MLGQHLHLARHCKRHLNFYTSTFLKRIEDFFTNPKITHNDIKRHTNIYLNEY